MKKIILFGGSIICLFILCSLTYQPAIAVQVDNMNYYGNKSKSLLNKENNVKNISGWFLDKLLDLIRKIIIFFLRPFILPLYMLLLFILYSIFPH